jgi:hypothetical protein
MAEARLFAGSDESLVSRYDEELSRFRFLGIEMEHYVQ